MVVALGAGLLELSVRVLLRVSPLHLPVLGDAESPLAMSLTWEGTLGPNRSWSPTLGWENEPGVHQRIRQGDELWPAETVEPSGARRTTPVSLTLPDGHRRAVVVGDSFAYGMEVGDADVFTATAEQALPSWEIDNYAVPGFGQDQALLQLRERGLPLHPDVVVFGHAYVDQERSDHDFTFARKPRFVVGPQGLELRGVPVPDALTLAELDRRRIKTLDVLTVLARQTGWSRADWRASDALSEAILRAVVSESRAAGAVPVLIFMPTPTVSGRYRDVPSVPFDAVCAGPGVRCVDLRAAFDEAVARGESVREDQHWSAAGHRIAAEALVKVLGELPP